MNHMPDDRRLLLQMHNGHESAARELWQRFAPRMLSYAGSIVGSGAEDVVQSVFMTVLQQPRSVVKGVKEPGAWLLVLTRRSALNHLRANRRSAARCKTVAETPRACAPLAFGETESLSRAVGALPRRLREVVILRHIAGLTFDQVAIALGANRNTAAARYREAIRRLKIGLEHVLSGSAS